MQRGGERRGDRGRRMREGEADEVELLRAKSQEPREHGGAYSSQIKPNTSSIVSRFRRVGM